MGVSLMGRFDGGTVLELAGLVLIVAGVGFMWWPAAVVAAGVACLLAAFVRVES